MYFNELAYPKSLCLACACNMFGLTIVALFSRAAVGDFMQIIEHCVYGLFCLIVRATQLFVLATRTFVETKGGTNSDIEHRLCTNSNS